MQREVESAGAKGGISEWEKGWALRDEGPASLFGRLTVVDDLGEGGREGGREIRKDKRGREGGRGGREGRSKSNTGG